MTGIRSWVWSSRENFDSGSSLYCLSVLENLTGVATYDYFCTKCEDDFQEVRSYAKQISYKTGPAEAVKTIGS